jgi:hypothetical protein
LSSAQANPVFGVASQGNCHLQGQRLRHQTINAANNTSVNWQSFIGSSHLTITAANNAYINWQSFNIGAGETTTFVQPSSSSVVWNQINGPESVADSGHAQRQRLCDFAKPGRLLRGRRRRPSTAHGLVMTTAPMCPPPDLDQGAARGILTRRRLPQSQHRQLWADQHWGRWLGFFDCQ